MANKKGQAAMEFLTTYGWAFLIIIVAVAGLFYFGVFDTSKYKEISASFDADLQAGTSFAVLDNGIFMVQLKNNNMKKITLDSVTIYEENMKDSIEDMADCTDTFTSGADSPDISPGEFAEITVNLHRGVMGLGSSPNDVCGLSENTNQKKTFIVEIKYKAQGTDIVSVSKGKVTAIVIDAVEDDDGDDDGASMEDNNVKV
ncbi:MAG: hypothetical protein AB7V77_01790 [Candidatus Woesearchaeota archaeon]